MCGSDKVQGWQGWTHRSLQMLSCFIQIESVLQEHLCNLQPNHSLESRFFASIPTNSFITLHSLHPKSCQIDCQRQRSQYADPCISFHLVHSVSTKAAQGLSALISNITLCIRNSLQDTSTIISRSWKLLARCSKAPDPSMPTK